MLIPKQLILFGYVLVVAGYQVERTLQLKHLYLSQTDDGLKFVIISPTSGLSVVHGELGLHLDSINPTFCKDENDSCLNFGNNINLRVSEVKDKCLEISWSSSENCTMEDCISFGSAHWYGGPEHMNQQWPVEKLNLSEYSYVNKADDNCGSTEPYWLNSEGSYVYVDPAVPLFIDTNHHRDNAICFISKQAGPYLPRSQSILKYTVCSLSNVKRAHRHAIKHFWKKPSSIPDQRMVEHPIWSTWVRYKADISDEVVREYAQEIVDHGFNNSQLEIDDAWETCYGSAHFNKSRFPDMQKLSKHLKNEGFRVTLWNHPFINVDCDLFKKVNKSGYFVKDQSGNTVSSWWDGKGGVIDFTNVAAVEWYRDRRQTMMDDNGIDSMKFDAGETSWLPQLPSLNVSADYYPKDYSAKYVEAVAKFSNMVEVRVTARTQDQGVFVRMLDKDSKWDFRNGLPTLLTTLFQLNVVGYPFVLPDMVGGNAYSGDVITKELFVRWLQATTFMPSIQFSVTPWDYDEETVAISKKFTALHYQYADTIIRLMNNSMKTGDPINMPIWWVAPTDKTALACWDEYLLGEDILVAPVLQEGALERDIYLPEGHWKDEAKNSKKVYHGKHWIRNYKADLSTLPFFTRVK